MTKRLTAWAIALALLLSQTPQLMLGVTAETPAAHSHSAAQHDCEHCDGTITWTAWDKTTTLPSTTGHYYLTADVNLSAATRVEADQDVVLCLNGWNITGGYNPENVSASKSFSIFDLRGKLTISDCTAYTDADGVFHAGKIQKGYRTDSGGTAFWCRFDTAILVLHDVIVADHYSPFNTSTWGGGAIYLREGAKAELNDSVFTGCKTDAEGGVVLLRSNSILIANGCTFENNTAKVGGSVIYSPNANTVTLHDCKITGNNVAGKDSVHKGAVYFASANDKLTISGKTVIDENYVAVDGTPVESNVYLQRELNTPVDIGGLTDGAKISIRTYYAAPATPTMVKAATAPTNWYHGYVLYENNGKAIAYNSTDGFHFVENDIHEHCECGNAACTDTAHQKVEYKPWNNKTALPSSGNYYLNVDVNLANETSVTADTNLCLNGHTVKAATGKQIITTPKDNALTLVISDCTATTEDGVYKAGVLTGGVDSGKGRGGGAIQIRDKGNLKLYDGIITGNTSDTSGGAIRLGAGASFFMYDGEISNNTSVKSGAYKSGGAISALTGCTIQILGGTIKGNTGSDGGAIYTESNVTISNCTISGNTAVRGGAVFVVSGKTATFTDCVIKDNKASGEGAAAIFVNSATATLTGCEITGNRVTTATQGYSGSAIYSPGSSTITLKDCTITDNTFAGTSTGYRGAVYTAGTGDKLILTGNVVIKDNYVGIDGTKLERNIFLYRKHTTPMDVGGLTDGSELTIFTHYGSETEPVMVKADKAPTAWVRGWVVYDNNGMAVDYDPANNKFFFTLNAEHIHCECGATDCTDSTHELTGYKAWNDATSLPTAGNYFLNVDVNLAGETSVSADLNLCLHGHTVTAAKDKQIITTPNNTNLMLTITDCTATYENGQYKAGKLTGGVEKASLGRGGGAIYIRAEGDMKLYDGIITGNTSGTGGGAIRLGKNATFVMYDGEISDNTAINGTTLRTGGAISAIGGTDIQILGGTIKNNQGGNGGAIYTEGKLTVRDGVITGNSGTNGGAIYVMDNAQLQLLGGEITANTSTTSAGGVYISASGKITVGGEPIVKGNTKNGAASNLQLQGNVVMTLDQVGEKAFLGISAESVFRTISTKTDKDLSSQFVSDRATMMVLYQDSALYLGASDGHKHCLCAGLDAPGCNHNGVAFAPWDDTTSLPASGNWYLTADVNLAESKTLNTEELNLCLNGFDINLANCKNGRLVYLKGTSKLSITDCTEEPGVISGANKSAVQFENNKAATPVFNLFNGVFTNNTSLYGGGAVLVQGSGTFNMYGGKLTGNYIEARLELDTDGNPVVNSKGVQQVINQLGGGAVCVYGVNATTNIYGGVISDNWTTGCQRLNGEKLETVGGTGGAIYTESDINIYGGEITGNKALDGGGVLGATRVVITMTGGTISGNTAERNGGGVVSYRGEIRLSGGVISENTAKAGGGIRAQGVAIYLDGTDIINNRSTEYAGGIRLSQDLRNGVSYPNKLVFTAGSISGNSTGGGGGGILLEGAGSELIMTGGEISGNTAGDTAGGAYISSGTTFTMEGGKISGNTAKTAGAIRMYKSTVNLKAGQVTGNKSTSNCAGIYVTKIESTLNLMGGEITNNISGAQAGGVLVEDRATMNFSSGKISGNITKDGGGAIFVSTNSFLNMTGGSITGNHAKNGGGIYCYRGKQLNLTGGSISYNTCDNGGAGVRTSSGNLKLGGVSIVGNKSKVYGGGVYAGGAAVTTNGVKTTVPSTVVMSGAYISNNTAVSAGGGVLLESKGSTWTMYGGSISNNVSEKSNGGGMYVSRNTKLYVHGGRINNNSANSSGSAVYHLRSEGVYKNCEISGNEGRNGSITCGKGCGVELENVTAVGNTVPRYGGLLYVETEGTATVKNCTFIQNTAGMMGGALFSNTGARMTITDCVFTENHAEKRGGAVGIYESACITGCVFTGNSAVNGGAIYSGDESQRIACNGWGDVMFKDGLQVIDCEFKDNTASDNGGAMYAFMSCYVDVVNTTFTGNQAVNQGSAIWTSENLTMQDLIITGNTSTGDGYAVFLADAEYDGHSYIRGTMKMAGDMLITDNKGGDLYLDRTTTLAISSQGLGKNTEIGVTLDSGLLTQRLFGSYNYEGGDCVYTVTYGDRSLTDPEYDPSMVVKPEAPEQTETPQQTEKKTDTWLYVGIGAVAVVLIALVVMFVMKKKKSAGAETK